MNRPKPKIPVVKVKSKIKRKIIHSLWPKLIQGQVWGAREGIRHVLMFYSDGLSEKEVAYIEKREQQLALIDKELNKMYYRLKF